MRENALGTVFGVLNTACLVQSWTGCEITALSLRQGSKIYMFCVLNRVSVSLCRPNPPTQIPVEYTPPPPPLGEHSLRKCDPRLSRYVYVFSVFLNVAVSFRGRCCFQSSYVFFFCWRGEIQDEILCAPSGFSANECYMCIPGLTADGNLDFCAKASKKTSCSGDCLTVSYKVIDVPLLWRRWSPPHPLQGLICNLHWRRVVVVVVLSCCCCCCAGQERPNWIAGKCHDVRNGCLWNGWEGRLW